MRKHTPSNVLRRIVELANKKELPTQREWDELVAMAENSIAKTILKYAKEGKQPPEVEWFDGENFKPENILTHKDLEEAVEKLKTTQIAPHKKEENVTFWTTSFIDKPLQSRFENNLSYPRGLSKLST